MSKVPRLPLFPLQQPLFPGIELPLQIFEQRYLTLVRDVMRTSGAFGIVPITSGREVGSAPDIHCWGVLVAIRDWRQLDNGLLGITVAGDQRIRVDNVQVQSDGLLRGDAEVFPPDELEAVSDDDRDLLELFEDLAGQLRLAEWLPDAEISISALGWRLLSLLPFDPQWRLGLLAEDDPRRRLKAIRRHLVDLSRH